MQVRSALGQVTANWSCCGSYQCSYAADIIGDDRRAAALSNKSSKGYSARAVSVRPIQPQFESIYNVLVCCLGCQSHLTILQLEQVSLSSRH